MFCYGKSQHNFQSRLDKQVVNLTLVVIQFSEHQITRFWNVTIYLIPSDSERFPYWPPRQFDLSPPDSSYHWQTSWQDRQASLLTDQSCTRATPTLHLRKRPLQNTRINTNRFFFFFSPDSRRSQDISLIKTSVYYFIGLYLGSCPRRSWLILLSNALMLLFTHNIIIKTELPPELIASWIWFMFTWYNFQFAYRLGSASVCPSKAFFDPLLALITYMCGRPTVSASPREADCFTIFCACVCVCICWGMSGEESQSLLDNTVT